MPISPERVAAIRARTRAMRAPAVPAPGRPAPCRHLGGPTGATVDCPSCGGKRVALKVFACAVHGECVQARRPAGVASCDGCPDRA